MQTGDRPRGRARTAGAWRGVFLAYVLGCVGTMACGTDPVSTDGCRKIEYARCEVAPACPAMGITDVDGCKRFYRDQCLHGLATSADPGGPNIDKCVAAITAAGQCAATGASNCTPATIDGTTDPCGIVERPERSPDCGFLIPPIVPAGGSGGAQAGGSGGSAGSG